MSEPRRICIALFGGTGQRFGAPHPKQFVPLGPEPMVVVTLTALSECPDIQDIYVVSERNSSSAVFQLVLDKNIAKVRAVINGGATRQESARLALEYLDSIHVHPDSLVMIVDGDRPCVDPELVRQCYEEAERVGASVAALPSTESILISKDGKYVSKYLDRKQVFSVQTPQTFRFSLIYQAHEKFAKKEVTDDASLVRLLKKPIAVVLGNKDNIKVTVPEDVNTYLAWKENHK